MSKRIAIVLLVAVALLAIGGIAAAQLGALRAFESFTKVDSAADLTRARGVVYGVSGGAWVLSGEWELNCRPGGCEGDVEDISFDLAHVMVMPGDSHSHVYTDFVAVTSTLRADSITIEGTIVGSGPVGGPTDIVIELVDIVDGNSGFFFELPANLHLTGRIGGVIVESKGSR